LILKYLSLGCSKIHNLKIKSYLKVFLLSVVLTAPITTLASAKYASIIVDATSGKTLYSRNANKLKNPASLTKMMTLYMVFDSLEEGALRLNQRLRVSQRAAGQPASKLGLKPGEFITVQNAINALAVKSANDVATVIAESISGTEISFAKAMTKKAHSLGMKKTEFRNASGLYNKRQKTTAKDMSILAAALITKHNRYYKFFATPSFTHKSKKYINHNSLLRNYKGTDGIKTGYIRASGFNLVASSVRGNVRLIGVVFGGKSAVRRDRHMKKLFNRNWNKARALSTLTARPISKPWISNKSEVAKTAEITKEKINSPNNYENNWGIQIGTFKKYDNAYVAASNTAHLLLGLPSTAFLKIQPKNHKSNTLFRVRFMGLDGSSARSLCKQLLFKGNKCFVLTPE
jgi:D-alanyl-D-alanine carboxypeptidase|tara:strand:+ start:1118 stop:2326 length:1209 start_codon:yes stop_codon:yes gene_type:complete